MAEPTTNPPAAVPPAGRGRKRGLPPKLLGLPTPVVLAGGAALAALGFLWWRSHRSGAGGAAPTSTASAATADAADLAGLQSELDQLLGGQGGGGSGGGVGGGGGGTSVVSTSTPPVSTSSSGTTSGNPTSTATSKTTPPAALAVNPVKNLRIVDDGYTSVIGEWDKSPNATSYLISILQGGSVIKQQHSVGQTARVGNLKRGTAYTYRVRAQPGGTGGRDANVQFTTKKG